MFIVTFVGRCKSRKSNKVVNAFHFQFLLSETGTYLWHLYCATCIVPAWFLLVFFYFFFLNFITKDGFIGEFISCLPYIFDKQRGRGVITLDIYFILVSGMKKVWPSVSKNESFTIFFLIFLLKRLM